MGVGRASGLGGVELVPGALHEGLPFVGARPRLPHLQGRHHAHEDQRPQCAPDLSGDGGGVCWCTCTRGHVSWGPGNREQGTLSAGQVRMCTYTHVYTPPLGPAPPLK